MTPTIQKLDEYLNEYRDAVAYWAMLTKRFGPANPRVRAHKKVAMQYRQRIRDVAIQLGIRSE